MREEQREERKEEIIVLDEGIDPDSAPGPLLICCGGALAALR